MMRFVPLLAVMLAALLSACSDPAAPSRLDTPQGPLVGQVSDAGVHDFRSIPFAQAPVGDMRFRPPGPAPQWETARDATAFSPMCMQSTNASGELLDRVVDGHGLGWARRTLVKRVAGSLEPGPVSEDCLYLNVRTPDPAANGDAALPVMVWIHGGGHQFGSADFGIYQGDALPARGVVVVTPNYRLNAFGYLAHPALSADSPDGVSGNYGLADQIAALEWVQANIASFGGDPDRVTVFGESAGASSVAALMASPRARGLFHRAVMQSGESTRALRSLRGDGRGDSAEAFGQRLMEGLGAATAGELRALPADAVLEALGGADDSATLRPVADGVWLPVSPAVAFRDGAVADVPAIIGYNADEGGIFYGGPQDAGLHADLTGDADARVAALRAGYGAAGEAIARLYGLDGTRDVDAAARDLMGDELFGVSTRYLLDSREAAGGEVWAYAFTRVPPSGRQTIGAFHSAEIPFLFGTLEGALGVSDADAALEDLMQGYWVSFAKDGDPNGSGLPDWPLYRGRNWMEFTANTGEGAARTSGVVADWRKRRLDALSQGLDPVLRNAGAARPGTAAAPTPPRPTPTSD